MIQSGRIQIKIACLSFASFPPFLVAGWADIYAYPCILRSLQHSIIHYASFYFVYWSEKPYFKKRKFMLELILSFHRAIQPSHIIPLVLFFFTNALSFVGLPHKTWFESWTHNFENNSYLSDVSISLYQNTSLTL